MNKRIRELAHEAGLPTYNPDGIPTKLEKFAELIVRECGKVAFNDWCEGTNESSSQIAILKHFNVGVEE